MYISARNKAQSQKPKYMAWIQRWRESDFTLKFSQYSATCLGYCNFPKFSDKQV